jgi:hypothetical protein
MVSLNDRERAFEAKYANDQEAQFKLTARRNRIFAEWAASKLGIAGDDREAYSDSVIVSDLAEPGDGDILRKVKADFEQASIEVREQELKDQLDLARIAAQDKIVSKAD